jgi:hypothetical protein
LSKVLFYDLSRQTLAPGILTDYDATSAFDRVLATLSIVTSCHVGLPQIAGIFMFNLLREMSFSLITGFGKSASSYNNDTDGIVGQGVLQGSSSAAPLYILSTALAPASATLYQKNIYPAMRSSMLTTHLSLSMQWA